MTIIRKTLINLKIQLFGYDFYGKNIRLPWNHPLPFILRKHPKYSYNIVEEAMKCKGTIIDIGANIGDTVIMLRSKIDRPILAIEPNDTAFKYLIQNSDVGNVTLVNEPVGYNNPLDDILGVYPEFKEAGFLKIDTDGQDIEILYGAKKYLAKVRPAIFFEYDPKLYNDDCVEVFDYLGRLKYGSFDFYDNTGKYFIHLEYPKDKAKFQTLTNYAESVDGFYFDIAANQ